MASKKVAQIKALLFLNNPNAVVFENGVPAYTVYPEDMTVAEAQMWAQLQEAIQQVNDYYLGAEAEISLDGLVNYQSEDADLQQNWDALGITPNLPIVFLKANYEDGSAAYFHFTKTAALKHSAAGALIPAKALNLSTASIREHLFKLYNIPAKAKTGDNKDSWLCRAVPALCNADKYLFLAGAAICTVQTFRSPSKIGQVAYGSGAILLANEFWHRGGFSSFKNGK